MTTSRRFGAHGHGIRPPHFRLPSETRLGRVQLQVAELGRSIAYYRDVLGLRAETPTAGRATLHAHQDDRVLIELVERPGAAPVPPRGRLGLFHVAILLPDRAALGRMVSHLAEIGERAGMSDHLVSEALYLTDPDGLGLEVYADRPSELWEVRDGEIAMATEPLDVRSLVLAANGAPWTGAPAGTTVGHVHLCVGDLTAAATFYHDGLGFDKTVWQYPGALFLAAGGYHHHLGTNIWAHNAVPALVSEARLLEWEIVVPHERDVQTLHEHCDASGVAVARERQAIIVTDPWGTRVRVRAEQTSQIPTAPSAPLPLSP